jgi:dienelactone hydrolase
MAARKGGRNISPALINPVAVTFGIPDEKIADTETAEKIKKIHTEAALFSTQNVVNWVEEFAGDAGKKLMIMLSFGRGNVAKHLSGEPRFDQNFVDWLKDKPYPVIDMRDIFALDYKKHKVDIDQYLAPFYNGHHSHGIKTICGVLKTDYPPYALQAVRSGYVVLAPGWWGWPGRDGHLDRIGDRDKCNVIQMAASMYGINILDLHIQDGRVAVDVLCSLAEVDAKKIGCIGNSYGGRTTMWLTIFDDRIKACVPSGCMNIFRERSLKLSSCAIQYLPGSLQYGDVPELFSLIAPRPMQLQAGEGDNLITPSDREQIKQVVKKAYRLLGAEKNFEYVLHSRGHTFAWNLAAPFFKRHLEIDR